MRSREAWTEPKKRWRDGTAGIADRAIAEPGSTGSTTQVVNTATSSGSQKSLPIAFNHTGERVGSSYPIGPIMKVKYFRLNIVFESSVTVLWALVYVPDGLPIGRLNVAGSQADSVPGALYEPQQFIIASGVYEPG